MCSWLLARPCRIFSKSTAGPKSVEPGMCSWLVARPGRIVSIILWQWSVSFETATGTDKHLQDQPGKMTTAMLTPY